MKSFRKCKRNSELLLLYDEWRLASVLEVKGAKRENLKEMGIFKSDTARLLDGCLKENYIAVKDYVDNMEYMILIKGQASRPNVDLSNNARFDTFESFLRKMYTGFKWTTQGRQAAVLLSCEDKITEAICSVLYSIVQEPLNGKRQEELSKLTETLKQFGNGRTLLHYAVDQGHSQNHGVYVAECLKKNFNTVGEDLIKTADIDGKTALHVAAYRGNTDLCKFLVEDCMMTADTKDKNNENLLHFAVKSELNDIPLCELPGVHNIIGSRDHQGKTALHKAAALGKEKMVEILLSIVSNCTDKQMYFAEEKLLEQRERGLPEEEKIRLVFVRQADIFGQTALLEAARVGSKEAVKLLLETGSRPLYERNSDGRSALHYAVQLPNEKAKPIALLLLENCKSPAQKGLLLWASATGTGTAEHYLKRKSEKRCPDHGTVEQYLKEETDRISQSLEDLLTSAIEQGHEKMAWELVTRGANTAHIKKRKWNREKQKLVDNLLKQIDKMVEPGRDQPANYENLERNDFAQGLAALFLNPYVKSPLTVGIFGDGGMGKSRLMLQTEIILLKTRAQLAFPNLLETEQFPGCIELKQSRNGRRKYEKINRAVKNLLPSSASFETRNGDEAAVGSSNHYHLGKIPTIIIVRYSAWHHQTESEAWAGLAVEITKAIEESMTTAQRVRCHSRYAWRKHRNKICFELFLPCFFALILSACVALVVWKLISSSKNNNLVKLSYGSIPITILLVVWNVVKQYFSVIKPICDQTKEYFSVPDHTEKLGYQDQVISDIKFLNVEICEKPSWIWKCIGSLCNLCPLYRDYSDTVKATSISKSPAPGKDGIRMIIFVHDLDRCEHTVILKVLSAVHLVLAACHINVILGIDEKMITRAMKYQFPDNNPEEFEELKKKYIRERIQLPLVLSHTGEDETKKSPRHKLEVTKHENAEPKEWSSCENQSLTEHNQDHVCDIVGDDKQTCQKNSSSFFQEYSSFRWFKNCLHGCMKVDQKETRRKLGTMSLNIKMIMANYSDDDRRVLDDLIETTISERGLQAEWNQFLAYHRVAWNILSQNDQVIGMPGWQMQLIVWVFYCWQWEDQMNDIIKDWDNLVHANGPADGHTWCNSLYNIIKRYQLLPAEIEREKNCEAKKTKQDTNKNKQRELKELDGTEEEKKKVREMEKDKKRRKDWSSLQNIIEASKTSVDVSLDCMLYFQNFRLHCNNRHLSRNGNIKEKASVRNMMHP